MHAHRGREILVLPASCSSGSGHHHCHFTSDCTDSGNCLLLAVAEQPVKGVGRRWRRSCLLSFCPRVSAVGLPLDSPLDVSVCFHCPGGR